MYPRKAFVDRDVIPNGTKVPTGISDHQARKMEYISRKEQSGITLFKTVALIKKLVQQGLAVGSRYQLNYRGGLSAERIVVNLDIQKGSITFLEPGTTRGRFEPNPHLIDGCSIKAATREDLALVNARQHSQRQLALPSRMDFSMVMPEKHCLKCRNKMFKSQYLAPGCWKTIGYCRPCDPGTPPRKWQKVFCMRCGAPEKDGPTGSILCAPCRELKEQVFAQK